MANVPLKSIKFSDLPDTYTIPTKVSDLTNDTGFVTAEIFWATYNTTTSAQIEAAYQAGKLCGVEYNNRIYFLEYRTSATKHGFRVVDVASQEGIIYSLNCISDVWSTSTLTLAKSSAIPSASSATPQALGTAAAGSSGDFSRADHVHENNTLWVTYGSATSAEIEAAYQAHKIIKTVNSSGYVFEMVQRDSATKHIFTCTRASAVWSLTVNSDVWGSAGQRTVLQTSTSNPSALGTADPGSSSNVSKYDHVHPMPSASDVGAVAVAQGVGHAGEFLVVGSDGNVTTVTMTAWQGGSY